jgi:hypothetical protein
MMLRELVHMCALVVHEVEHLTILMCEMGFDML